MPSSLTRDLPSALRLLPPPTCVGLRYGQPMAPPDLFSAPQARSDHLWVSPPALDHPSEARGLSPSPPHRLRRGLQPHAQPTSKRSLASLALAPCTIGRYRNINLLSIAYGFYPLGLGPTNPTRIHLPSETLGLRRTRFPRAFSLLIPAFALRLAPGLLTDSPSSRPNAPLPKLPSPTRTVTSTDGQGPLATASVVDFSPDGLSVQDHSTSELLRTLSRMAASKPTSWLSE